MSRNFINVQSALMRKRCLNSVADFDEALGALEDWWYWVQLSRNHRFFYIRQPLARYRVHNRSMHAERKRRFPVSRIKIFKRMLRKYQDIPDRTKADINYCLGIDLLSLGKNRFARPFLLKSAKLSITNARGLARSCKALARFVLSLTPHRRVKEFGFEGR